MRLNGKNLAKMNPSQKRKYTKQLAKFRKYAKDKYAWEKLVRSGNNTYPTLSDYRRAKHGELEAAVSNKQLKTISKQISEETEADKDLIILRRLVAKFEQAEQIRKEAKEELKKWRA